MSENSFASDRFLIDFGYVLLVSVHINSVLDFMEL